MVTLFKVAAFTLFRVVFTQLKALNLQVISIFRDRRFFLYHLQPIKMGFTINFLNIRTPKKFVVITLKFELCGSIIE